jgi:hypothetical protein
MVEKNQGEDKWCIYGHLSPRMPTGFGMIERITEGSVTIRYSENQKYSPEAWERDYVITFPTLEEAVKYFIQNNEGKTRTHNPTDQEIKKLARAFFPSYYQNE